MAWHTGIKIGADKQYSGTRFYNQSPDISGAAVIMNVGVGNDNIGVVNALTVGGVITATGGNSTQWNSAYANQGNYLPLAGGIMSGNVGRSAHNVGFQVGGYNNVGDNATASNPIYAIGTSYMPAVTTLSNMYGIGYCHPSASFIGLTGASGWGMYVASDGDARIWLDGGSGTVSTAGAMYAGIYYDYNNTAYYANLAATSDNSTAVSLKVRQTQVLGDSATYNQNDGGWGARLIVSDNVHARIDVAQDANAVRASWWTHTGHLYSTFGTVTNHGMYLMSYNSIRQK